MSLEIMKVKKDSDGETKPIKQDLTTQEEKEKFQAERAVYIKMLYMSARDGDFDMVKLLIEKKKVSPNETIDDHGFPLHFAIKFHHNDIAKYLVEHGAEINSINPSNASALHFARFSENIEMQEYLLEKGANPLIQTNDLYLPFDRDIEQKLITQARQLMLEKIKDKN